MTIEVWGEFPTIPHRQQLGTASTIRGVRAIAKRHMTVRRIILRGSTDALDRANGLSLTWSKDVDLVTRYVPIDYEILKEST